MAYHALSTVEIKNMEQQAGDGVPLNRKARRAIRALKRDTRQGRD